MRLALRSFDFATWKEAVLLAGAALAWPLAIAINHGYDRGRVGVGGDEMQALSRALVLAVAVSAIPSAIVGKYGVVGVSGHRRFRWRPGEPRGVRFVARKNLHRRQAQGQDVRRW